MPIAEEIDTRVKRAPSTRREVRCDGFVAEAQASCLITTENGSL
jgi:hypothetical protein